MSALLITPNGDVVEIDLPSGSREHLTVMYAVLRCREVDVVRLTSSLDMWIDGENHADEPNVPATLFASQFGQVTQVICGPVLITGGGDDEGETLPLTKDKLLAVLTKLSDDADRLKGLWPQG